MYYTLETIKDFLKKFKLKELKVCSRKRIKYYNIPCAFDTESTSAYIDKHGKVYQAKEIAKLREEDNKKEINQRTFNEDDYKKIAWMYIWMLSINDNIIVGRTWEEYLKVLKAIKAKFKLSKSKQLIIYVHNLSHDFQFLRKHCTWQKVFATEPHKIIYAETDDGFTYKCSYFLSNSSLETVGKNLIKYKSEKKVGDLNYDLIRTSETPLSDTEIDYCLYDVIVLSNYIKECMEKEKSGKIVDIPLTATGYVRRYCREYCIKNNIMRINYQKLIKKFTLDEELYIRLKKAFQGGFTHANALNMGQVFKNVFSTDFTSSYPGVLLMRKYPMGKGFKYNPKSLKDFKYQINKFCCLFDVTFNNLRLKENVPECIISKSDKLHVCVKPVINNGRIERCEKITMTITDADYKSIERFYDWDGNPEIGYFRRYKKDYLPKELLECILKFYSDKTKLKDVIGEEVNYQNSKSLINAIFGMMVTDPVREEMVFDEEGKFIPTSDTDFIPEEYVDTREKAFEHYNHSRKRFIAYEWGVWCTAYARQNLFSGILELGSDFIYSDTDSLKFVNYEKHKQYFENYNNYVLELIDKVCKYYEFDKELFMPKTIKGKVKTIGVWDLEGVYDEFKTLGAKRYMVRYNKNDEHYKEELDGVSITVSGINKKKALPALVSSAKKKHISVFDLFDDDMYIGCEESGKLLHTYIDREIEEEVTDYLGNISIVNELSSVHLEPTSYSLSIADDYLNYVAGVRKRATKTV